MRAPCAGQWQLFDSPAPRDHLEAARLCRECPVLDACRERLRDAARDAYSPAYGPTGTWAGELVAAHAMSRQVIAREDAAYDETEARRAHAAWAAGERGVWAETGERVYQRRKKREQRRAVA